MAKKIKNTLRLSDYLDEIISQGRHYFTVDELRQAGLTIQEKSISVSLSRLAKKGRIRMLRRGFGIVLGPESSELHPSYFLDAMMKFIGREYYIGLLSAAAHWGASHQASMAYQVITDKVVSSITFKRGRIEFVTKGTTFPEKCVDRVASVGGYYLISSPELTAIDLVRFPQVCGYFNNVATVLSDLAEKWDGRKMISLCHDPKIPNVTLQRLGYMLDKILGYEKEAEYIFSPLEKRKYTPAMLSSIKDDKKIKRSKFKYDEKWKLYINTQVEPD
ncbi:MAG: hypothetical protein HOE90_15940 [Bacteriovoracaceae bacterium]|nr:hypothetical protein [Bacteriovoracaceae bacterium]